MSVKKKTFGARELALASLLTAIVVVLQVIANFVQPVPGVSLTFVLVPVVIGAALLGPWVGAWLGFVFGVVVLVSGGATVFLEINPFGTILTVLVKGACAGLCAGLVYRLLEKVNPYLAVFAAAIVCPTVNTGLFFVGCVLFFWETVQGWGAAAGFKNTFTYMILGLVGVNFIVEMAVNVVLSPVIMRLIALGKRGE